MSTSLAHTPPVRPNGSLKDAIWSVLSRNEPLGTENNPFRLAPLIVEAKPRFVPRAEDADLVDLMPFLMDSASQFNGSPLLSDTLMPLVRQEGRPDPALVYDWLLAKEGSIDPTAGWYQPTENSTQQDTIALTNTGGFNDLPYNDVLKHEFGHAFDLRGIFPALTEEVNTYYPEFQQKFPDSYAASNPREHFAETFSQAVSLLGIPAERKELVGQILEQTKDRPEVLRTMQRLLEMPPFQNHPAAAVILALPVSN